MGGPVAYSVGQRYSQHWRGRGHHRTRLPCGGCYDSADCGADLDQFADSDSDADRDADLHADQDSNPATDLIPVRQIALLLALLVLWAGSARAADRCSAGACTLPCTAGPAPLQIAPVNSRRTELLVCNLDAANLMFEVI